MASRVGKGFARRPLATGVMSVLLNLVAVGLGIFIFFGKTGGNLRGERISS